MIIGRKETVFLTDDDAFFLAMVHDLVKMGLYLGDSRPYQYNKAREKGHALISIKRVEQFVVLSDYEKEILKFHMGVYGSKEYVENVAGWGNYEYTMKEMYDVFHKNRFAKLFHFCDDIHANFFETR